MHGNRGLGVQDRISNHPEKSKMRITNSILIYLRKFPVFGLVKTILHVVLLVYTQRSELS